MSPRRPGLKLLEALAWAALGETNQVRALAAHYRSTFGRVHRCHASAFWFVKDLFPSGEKRAMGSVVAKEVRRQDKVAARRRAARETPVIFRRALRDRRLSAALLIGGPESKLDHEDVVVWVRCLAPGIVAALVELRGSQSEPRRLLYQVNGTANSTWVPRSRTRFKDVVKYLAERDARIGRLHRADPTTR
jgi:hypothetical protein